MFDAWTVFSTIASFIIVYIALNIWRKSRDSRRKELQEHLIKRKTLLNENHGRFFSQLEKLSAKLRLDKDKKFVEMMKDEGRQEFYKETGLLDVLFPLSRASQKSLLVALWARPTNIFDGILIAVLRRVVDYQSAVIEAPGLVTSIEKEIDGYLQEVREHAKTHGTVDGFYRNMDTCSLEILQARRLMQDTGDCEEAIKIAAEAQKRAGFIIKAVRTWVKVMPSDESQNKNPLSDGERYQKLLKVVNE